LFNALVAITSKQAGFRSLGAARADTTTTHSLAELERDLIRAPARDASGRRLEASRRGSTGHCGGAGFGQVSVLE
jgi:hypothetical protein